jgi:hypothetical protein
MKRIFRTRDNVSDVLMSASILDILKSHYRQSLSNLRCLDRRSKSNSQLQYRQGRPVTGAECKTILFLYKTNNDTLCCSLLRKLDD